MATVETTAPVYTGYANGDCNGGFGGGGFVWAFLIFALLGFGGFGNGFNRGGEQIATSADVQRGFDTSEITRKLDTLGNGLCDGFYAQNTNILNGFSGVNASIANEGRAIQTQLADCCCTTQRGIDSVNYNNAINTASINANTTAMGQKILDTINQNKIESLQGRVNQLELQNAMCGVVRYPNGMTYNAGSSPFCNCNPSCSYPVYA